MNGVFRTAWPTRPSPSARPSEVASAGSSQRNARLRRAFSVLRGARECLTGVTPIRFEQDRPGGSGDAQWRQWGGALSPPGIFARSSPARICSREMTPATSSGNTRRVRSKFSCTFSGFRSKPYLCLTRGRNPLSSVKASYRSLLSRAGACALSAPTSGRAHPDEWSNHWEQGHRCPWRGLAEHLRCHCRRCGCRARRQRQHPSRRRHRAEVGEPISFDLAQFLFRAVNLRGQFCECRVSKHRHGAIPALVPARCPKQK